MSGKYNWEEAYVALAIKPKSNVIDFASRKGGRMDGDGEWWEGLRKAEPRQGTAAKEQKLQSLPWTGEVLAKSKNSGRAEAESPLKIWWLAQQRKKDPA